MRLDRTCLPADLAAGAFAARVMTAEGPCIVGIIGDDVGAVCRDVAAQTGIPVIPVQSEGFKGNKREGYEAACAALKKTRFRPYLSYISRFTSY